MRRLIYEKKNGRDQSRTRPKPCYHTISHPDRRLLHVNEEFVANNKEKLSRTWVGVTRANSTEMEIRNGFLMRGVLTSE